MQSVRESSDGAVPYLGWDMLCAELCFHMRVIELADEGVRPCLAGVDCDVHVILPMPLSPFLQQAEALVRLIVSVPDAVHNATCTI